jgi:hypothetical protein
MRPRLVDWSLFALTTISLLTGFVSFLVGKPEGRWLFVLHGALGLGIVLLLVWKLARVGRRLLQPHLWGGTMLVSALALALALLALGSGFVWASWQAPLGYPNGLNWHVIFGIALTVFLVAHMLLRFKPLQRQDVTGRRAALRGLAVLASGGALWLGQQGMNRTLALPGAERRFTGSREVGSGQGLAFPVTMWMLDAIPAIPDDWRLQVTGAVARPLTFDQGVLGNAPQQSVEAVLDCTGGWYTRQIWHGIPVAWLLEEAQPDSDARGVAFISATGYRWSVPLAEAQGLLLAHSVGSDRLDAGRGAPLRLVAPGRRGFQWVKWVTEVRLLTEYDLGQWGVIFTSGLGR